MPVAAQTSAVSRTSLVILAVIASGAAMFWLADILTPPAMAMFLAIVIDGFRYIISGGKVVTVARSRKGGGPLRRAHRTKEVRV